MSIKFGEPVIRMRILSGDLSEILHGFQEIMLNSKITLLYLHLKIFTLSLCDVHHYTVISGK